MPYRQTASISGLIWRNITVRASKTVVTRRQNKAWLLRSRLWLQRILRQRRRPKQRRATHLYEGRFRGSTWFLWSGKCVKGATPIRARRPDAVSIRAASHDSASLAGRPIRATRSMTLLNHRPLTTPVPLHTRWGLSRLSSHQSSLYLFVRRAQLACDCFCFVLYHPCSTRYLLMCGQFESVSLRQ